MMTIMTSPIASRAILTVLGPMRFPANVNNSALNANKNAVPPAAISPMYAIPGNLAACVVRD